MNDAPRQVASFILVGLPKTGKSTYLAALDVIIEARQSLGGLESAGFSEDRAYIQLLREAWLKGADMPRTTSADDSLARLHVRDPNSQAVAELFMPDLTGETFRDQCERREWKTSYRERLAGIAGILLFVHCEESAAHQPIGSSWPLEINRQEVSEGEKWATKYAARQTKLVELLQFISEVGAAPQRLRVAVMLSAWDEVEKAAGGVEQRPTAFLREEWPLLHQYLTSNPERFRVREYGVSARGGGKEDTSRLLEIDDPAHRVFVVDGDHRSNDLTRSIRWLLSLPVTEE